MPEPLSLTKQPSSIIVSKIFCLQTAGDCRRQVSCSEADDGDSDILCATRRDFLSLIDPTRIDLTTISHGPLCHNQQ